MTLQHPSALKEIEWVVVDLETTGGKAHKNSIIEVGAVKIKHGKIVDTFQSFVRPLDKIPKFVQGLTGITPDLVAEAPHISRVLEDFLLFFDDAVLVAHNAKFDSHFLQVSYRKWFESSFKPPFICTVDLSQKVFPELKRHSLDVLTENFNIVVENRHRALGDAEATAKLFLLLLDTLEEKGVTQWSQVKHYKKQTAPILAEEPLEMKPDILNPIINGLSLSAVLLCFSNPHLL
jgi:DNA polymerase III epsilon subunit family exonuclease